MTGRVREPEVDHPLAMGTEAMRRAGYATVDALVARLADLEADPVLRRAPAAQMRALLGGPPPEQAGEYSEVLARVMADVLPYGARTDHPGYFAFIPVFTTWPAALAELVTAAANQHCAIWKQSAGAAQVELEVIDWFRTWLGMPDGTAGVLVSGGSAANMTALLVARETAGGPSPSTVMYVSDQAHSSLARAARAMGLRLEQVRVLPTDERWRLLPGTVAEAVRADRQAGHIPFAVCASAGSANTGAVDPLDELADVCAREQLWLHVDAAYGGFAALTETGRTALAGIDRADSVTLDPHKWFYQPLECGSVLVRDGALLEQTFAINPDYLSAHITHDAGEVNFANRGLQMSRGFRALKVWVAVQTFGVAAFRAAIQRNMELAEFAEALIRSRAELALIAPATLGIVCFRREWPDCDEAETERRGLALMDSLERSGAALVSSTRLAGRHVIRICILNPASSEDHIRRVIEHFADAPAPPPIAAVTETTGQVLAAASEVLRDFPLLSGVADATIRAIRDRAVAVEVTAGAEVIRRWDADRALYPSCVRPLRRVHRRPTDPDQRSRRVRRRARRP
jgi:glutamate/tyrosine decarboxylase-like PLP-dependent enzyme